MHAGLIEVRPHHRLPAPFAGPGEQLGPERPAEEEWRSWYLAVARDLQGRHARRIGAHERSDHRCGDVHHIGQQHHGGRDLRPQRPESGMQRGACRGSRVRDAHAAHVESIERRLHRVGVVPRDDDQWRTPRRAQRLRRATHHRDAVDGEQLLRAAHPGRRARGEEDPRDDAWRAGELSRHRRGSVRCGPVMSAGHARSARRGSRR